MSKWSDGRKYEILYDLPEGEMGEVGGIRTRTIRAGDSLEVEVYPLIQVSPQAKREKKSRTSSAAMEAVNLRNARKRVHRLLEANFTENDIHLTLTFDYGFVDRGMEDREAIRRDWKERGFPEDDASAQRFVRNFIRRLRSRIRREGGDAGALKYLYAMESTKEPRDEDFDALPPRYHFHIVLSAPGLDREQIEALWPYGYANADRLRVRDGGLAALAKYITKQRRVTRRWAASRNLREPTVKISDRKVSRHRAERVARDVRAYGREIFEKLYPDYRLEEVPSVKFSEFVSGAYIYARMRRKGRGS